MLLILNVAMYIEGVKINEGNKPDDNTYVHGRCQCTETFGTFSQQNSSLHSDSNVCVTLYIIGGQSTPITVQLIEWSTVNVPGRMHEE